jgi:hypothetical protein
MYRMALCAAATLLVATAVQPATADDCSARPIWALDNEAIVACSSLPGPKYAVAYNDRGYTYYR